MIDWDRINELRDEVGEDDFRDVLGMFFEEVEAVLDGLSPGPTLARDLHFLKGSALNIGMKDVSDLCREYEQRLNEGTAVADETSAIVSAYQASKAEISNLPTRSAL